jgi:ATP-dependent Clp protease ATP-binding subunit ClpC
MMDLNKFTDKAKEALAASDTVATRYQHTQLDLEHLLLALLEQPQGVTGQILNKLGIDPLRVQEAAEALLARAPKITVHGGTRQIYITPGLQRLLDDGAWQQAQRLHDDMIAVEHLFLAILADANSPAGRLLREFGLNETEVDRALMQIRGSHSVRDEGAENRYQALERFSRDLTQLARQNQLDPVIGREVEIQRVIQVLSRRTKNNPALIGEPGVGKTAVVEGLAQKIINNEVPATLKNKRVVALDMGALVAGAKFRGEFEDRLKAVMDEIRKTKGEIVLFIDELHTVVGAGAAEGAIDASNMLKPALARGELQCIGATTLDEYRKHIEKDAALERRFAPVYVEEPSVEDTVEILKGLRPRYEEHHQVKITDEALEAAAKLSSRYLSGRFLPDKAIDLIDEAASKKHIEAVYVPSDQAKLENQIGRLEAEREAAALRQDYEAAARLKQETEALHVKLLELQKNWQTQRNGADSQVSADDIAAIVSQWSGIPVMRMFEAETVKLLRMEEALHKRVIGQHEAVEAVSEAIRRSRAGMGDPKRPIGSFIFLGPTGVGKTELARALAEFLFDDENAMVRIDMSEYMERFSVSRLIGAPPGYVGYEEGGQLTEAVRRRPYRVVLFDEIEKAHPDVFNILLQILEDGRLTDAAGRTVDFKHTLVIMTSNIGSMHTQASVGFNRRDNGSDYEAMKNRMLEDLRTTLRPELINRIDEIIVFQPLSQEEIKEIVDLMVGRVSRSLADRGIALRLNEPARELLAKEGFDPTYGARPLRRTIQRLVENPVSKGILEGQFRDGDTIVIDVENDNIVPRLLVAAPVASSGNGE